VNLVDRAVETCARSRGSPEETARLCTGQVCSGCLAPSRNSSGQAWDWRNSAASPVAPEGDPRVSIP
jgi:hypothetical protein